MRHSPSEKLEIIRILEDSELSVRQTLKEMGICGGPLELVFIMGSYEGYLLNWVSNQKRLQV